MAPWERPANRGPAAGPSAADVVASVQGRRSFASDDVERLEDLADVTFLSRPEAMSTREALSMFTAARFVAVTPKVAPPLDTLLLEGLRDLRGIVLYATGYDFIDVAELARRGVVLSILPSYSTRSVAEHTIGLMLTMSRRIHLGNDHAREMVPAGASLRGFELDGKTLGIIGCGRIGGTVATLAQAFGMRVIAHDIEPKPVAGVEYVSRATLLERSDIVTLHCPMTYGAPPPIGSPELTRMRPGVVLINSSRAALVDVGAVVHAIRVGHLRGYAVDDIVLAGSANGADLLREGRIVQTGHSAWWSDEVLQRGGRMWADHIAALVAGAPLDVVADPGAVARDTSVEQCEA